MPEDHCIFAVAQLTAAVPARDVVEIVPMPELSPLPETPSFVLGAFNLRGRGVPVVSLTARLLDEMQPPRAPDRVIVVEHDGALVGLHVTSVHDVTPLPESSIEDPLAHAHSARHARFLRGIAKREDALVALLDVASLVEVPEEGPTRSPREGTPSQDVPILRERARQLAKAPDREPEGQLDAAIVEMGGERIAIDARRVREFTPLRHVTPAPGAPPHILGIMSLRGAVVTIVDLRPVLALPPANKEPTLAAIVETPEGAIGLAIEGASDVAPLRFERREADHERHPHLPATATLAEAHVSLLDLERLLASGVLLGPQEASP